MASVATFMTSRVVHLDVCNNMETDSFIQPLRRFIKRRGNIWIVRSDNGSKFVGGKKELMRCTMANNDSFKIIAQIR